MKHNLEKYLEDIRLSISDIEAYVKNTNSAIELEANPILFDALCRRFAIIGEALHQANKLDRTIPISEKGRITGLRHIIVHDYDKVRAPDLWAIITTKLTLLKTEVEDLLDKTN
ncbi:MAG: hypothetical protein JWP69_704 [Flaviaesturariibacter sp.]|nr:hypothetical protein [Flaviaesturariibacter sp.]